MSGRRLVSSLLDRLRTGDDPGALRELMVLVARTASAMAATRRIVPPDGRLWTREDLEDLVGDFLAKPGRITDLVINCVDDVHFKARIETALKRVASDAFRRTQLGVLHRRVVRRIGKRD